MQSEIKNYEKIIRMKKKKQEFESQIGPFGEERLSENFSEIPDNTDESI